MKKINFEHIKETFNEKNKPKPITNKTIVFYAVSSGLIGYLFISFFLYSPLTLKGLTSLREDLGDITLIIITVALFIIITIFKMLHQKNQQTKVSSVEEINTSNFES